MPRIIRAADDVDYIRIRMQQIEADRQAARNPVVEITIKNSFRHPTIVASEYWHTTDVRADESWFDDNPTRPLAAYVSHCRKLPANKLRATAHEPYLRNAIIDNTIVLVARMMLLELLPR